MVNNIIFQVLNQLSLQCLNPGGLYLLPDLLQRINRPNYWQPQLIRFFLVHKQRLSSVLISQIIAYLQRVLVLQVPPNIVFVEYQFYRFSGDSLLDCFIGAVPKCEGVLFLALNILNHILLLLLKKIELLFIFLVFPEIVNVEIVLGEVNHINLLDIVNEVVALVGVQN